MAGDAALMEGRTPSAFLRRVAPSDGEITTFWQDCFSGAGGERACSLPANAHVGEGKNQTAVFSKANFLSDQEAAG